MQDAERSDDPPKADLDAVFRMKFYVFYRGKENHEKPNPEKGKPPRIYQ